MVLPKPDTLDKSEAEVNLPTLLRYSIMAFALVSPMPLSDCKVLASAVLIFTLALEDTALFADVTLSVTAVLAEVALSVTAVFAEVALSVTAVLAEVTLSVTELVDVLVAEVFTALILSLTAVFAELTALVAELVLDVTFSVTADFALSFAVDNTVFVTLFANEVEEMAKPSPNVKIEASAFM